MSTIVGEPLRWPRPISILKPDCKGSRQSTLFRILWSWNATTMQSLCPDTDSLGLANNYPVQWVQKGLFRKGQTIVCFNAEEIPPPWEMNLLPSSPLLNMANSSCNSTCRSLLTFLTSTCVSLKSWAFLGGIMMSLKILYNFLPAGKQHIMRCKWKQIAVFNIASEVKQCTFEVTIEL